MFEEVSMDLPYIIFTPLLDSAVYCLLVLLLGNDQNVTCKCNKTFSVLLSVFFLIISFNKRFLQVLCKSN